MRIIARLMAFYFLLGSFLPGADFSQLSKLPAALSHYQLHQTIAAEQGKTFPFRTFLIEHFWNPGHHDHGDDGQSHQDLPLKHLHSFDHLALQWVSALPCSPVETSRRLTERPPCFLPCQYPTDVFRPPVQA